MKLPQAALTSRAPPTFPSRWLWQREARPQAGRTRVCTLVLRGRAPPPSYVTFISALRWLSLGLKSRSPISYRSLGPLLFLRVFHCDSRFQPTRELGQFT